MNLESNLHAGSREPGENVVGMSQETSTLVQQYAMPRNTPIKRSKRREGFVDEDSSTRAERLKAKKNLTRQVRQKLNPFYPFLM
jgi:hypothetical protein